MFTPILKQLLTPVVRNIFDTYGSKMFSPVDLFTTGINGVWYDPSDLTTLYRDSAGTLPVTAVEQPVGLMRDKSGRNNHAFNSSGNSANFPVLSARYNLLTKTEQFDDAVWAKSGVTVSSTKFSAPDGTVTAQKIVETTGTVQYGAYQQFTPVAASHTYTFYAKAAERAWVQINAINGADKKAWINLSTGTVGVNQTNGVVSVAEAGSGWYKITLTRVVAVSSSYLCIAPAVSDGGANYTGDGTSGIYIWGADLRVTNDALNQPAYQRVNTATDYDTVGFKHYLKFNGVNQWLQTNSIDFSYGDKMFVSAGVRKLSDAERGIVVELGVVANSGTININAPSGASPSYSIESKGTSYGIASISTYVSPILNVISGIGDISGDRAILRVNGAQVAQAITDQENGNYGNYPLYIGARAGASIWFNGRMYGLVVAGKQTSAAEITSAETYINNKTGAYL